MANVKFELNREGVRELMRSPEMMKVCEKYAKAALGRLGGGYEMSTYVGENRVNAEVGTGSFKSRRENSKNNSILKALRG